MPDEPSRRAEAAPPPEPGESSVGAPETRTAAPNGGEVAGASASRPPAPNPPLITAVEIENFKGIGRPMRVELRPVTLLFGANSAGKSTVLQALCYAHEILSRGNVDAHATELGGDRIDLGGFRNFVHAHDLGREVRLRFELNLHSWHLPNPLRERLGTSLRSSGVNPLDHVHKVWLEQDGKRLRGAHAYYMQEDPASEVKAKNGWVEMTIRWDRLRDKPLVNSYAVGVNGSLIGRLQESPAGGVELLANLAHPWFGLKIDDHTIGAPREAGRLDKESETTTDGTDGGQNRRFAVRLLTSALPNWQELLYLESDDSANEPVELFEKLDVRASIGFGGLGISLRDALAGLRHIGPLRDLSPDCTERKRPDSGRWGDGSAAWDLLNDAARDDTALIRNSGDWLSREDRLGTGYELRVRSTVELPGDESLVATILESKRAKETSIEPIPIAPGMPQSPRDVLRNAEMELIESLANAIADAPVRKEVQLVSTRGGLLVKPSDIGVGISQILPVVVAALDPDRPELTVIEQPELHLHPRIQVEVGDLLAHQIHKPLRGPEDPPRGGVFLIETHSEHLLLRIMKRMRQTSDGTLPDGAPAIRPEDVAVFFVEIDPGGEQTLIREMPLNERGDLVKAWPGGFFEEDLREIF